MHLAMIVDSREAKETLLEDPNSGSDASLSSGSDDDSDAPLVRKQTNEFREKSNSGFRASMRGKRALKHIYSKILKLKEQTERSERQKSGAMSDVQLLLERFLEKIQNQEFPRRRKNGEKLSKSLEREYYEDGMPKPLRPVLAFGRISAQNNRRFRYVAGANRIEHGRRMVERGTVFWRG